MPGLADADGSVWAALTPTLKKKSLSLASISTRASSSASLRDLSVELAAPSKGRGQDGDRTSDSSTDDDWIAGSVVKRSSRRARRAAFYAAVALLLAGVWGRYVKQVARRRAKWGHGRLGLILSAGLLALSRLLGLTATDNIAAAREALQSRQVLACWHPHGLYIIAPLFFLSTGPRNRSNGLYDFFVAVADACFKFPLFREVLLLFNCRVASRRVVDSILGSGRSLALCPGGIHEQLETDPGREQVFFPPNLGFVRQALKHGVPLVPLYNFGENQLYDVPEWSRAVSRWLKRNFGIGLPLGFGRWGLPFVPRKQHISMRVGRPVEVGEANPSPSDEMVRAIFIRYCAELQRLFDEHSSASLPPEVAARGLRIVWRGHETEDLSASAVRLPSHGGWPPRRRVSRVMSAPALQTSKL